MAYNHFNSVVFCLLLIIIIELVCYNEKETDMGTLWRARFLFESDRIEMVLFHLGVWCAAISAEFVSYN